MTKPTGHLAAILSAINKEFKGAATTLSGGSKSDVKEAIPTGVEVLDKHVLGVGGLAVGRISEVFSEEGAGKTSLMLSCMAGAQRVGGIAILVETEASLDSKRAVVFGVDLDQVILLQPGHLGETAQQIETAIKAIPKGVGPVFLGWDSVAATMSREEALEGIPEKDSFDKRAKGISAALRVLGPLVRDHRTHLMCINQVRANIGVMFGDKFTTPGGKALKFHASIRLSILGGKAIKDANGMHLGKDITVMAVKNKLCRPFQKARVRLSYDDGFDSDWATLNHAKEMGVIGPRDRDVKAARAALEATNWNSGGKAVVTEEDAEVSDES